jgi:hypothetical protein
MYSTLNQLLYNNNKHAVSEETLVALEGFIMTATKREEWISTITARRNFCAGAPKAPTHSPVIIPTAEVEPPTTLTILSTPTLKSTDYFTPKQENTLFWCLFIGVYGYTDYLKIEHKYNNAEIEEKQALVEALGKTPRRLKETNHRITNQSIQELLSGVMVAKHDTLFSIIAYSVYYGRQVIVIFENNTYVRFRPEMETESNIVFLHCRVGPRRNIYSVELEPSKERMVEISEKGVELESYLKPLKGISSYKMPELEEIAKKIGVEWAPNAKQKKVELYGKIAEKCSFEKVHMNER